MWRICQDGRADPFFLKTTDNLYLPSHFYETVKAMRLTHSLDPHWSVDQPELIPSFDAAVTLLMKVVPILGLQVAEHNDGRGLRREICRFLAYAGYPGWLEERELAEQPNLMLATTTD